MATSKTTFSKDKPRPKGGRKKGVPNKHGPLTVDLVETMKRLGHDAAAEQVAIFVAARKQFLKQVKRKGAYGAIGWLREMREANSELLKYLYPTRKAVEGAGGKSLDLKTLADIITGEDTGDAFEGQD